MKVDVLLGLQWGDEGKGKIVDVLATQYDIIARFQGGPNAGHTLEFNGEKHVLHTIPSGIFHPNKVNIIGNGVIIDPFIFNQELDKIKKFNNNALDSLLISKKAHLILPTHKLLDAVYEERKGKKKIGSTLKGIGPSYTDKISRNGLRTGDLFDRMFFKRYQDLRDYHLELAGFLLNGKSLPEIGGQSFESYEENWLESIKELKKLQFIDSEHYINNALKQGKSVLAEGAQGTMLDIDFGSYPFVTSSNTIAAGVCSGLGVAPGSIGKVFGIFKAYCTRVGSGPFPTELFDETGNKLRTVGKEFGATTGRERRCGWIDMVALKYAIMINGVTDLIMTKVDVLNTFDQIKYGDEYAINNKKTKEFPFEMGMEEIKVLYKEMSGWNELPDSVEKLTDLPEALFNYVRMIETETDVPISYLSTGPDRTQLLILNN